TRGNAEYEAPQRNAGPAGQVLGGGGREGVGDQAGRGRGPRGRGRELAGAVGGGDPHNTRRLRDVEAPVGVDGGQVTPAAPGEDVLLRDRVGRKVRARDRAVVAVDDEERRTAGRRRHAGCDAVGAPYVGDRGHRAGGAAIGAADALHLTIALGIERAVVAEGEPIDAGDAGDIGGGGAGAVPES